MQSYIALLRGINVSGQKKIKMADLRELLSSLGWKSLKTYIQSGNIVFIAEEKAAFEWEQAIHNKIKEAYGFEVPVLVLKPEEVEGALEGIPFKEELENDPKRIFLTFLQQMPEQEKVDALAELDYSPERFAIHGKNAYIYSPGNFARAKLSNNFFEKKLKVAATTRNLRTSRILLDMVKELAESAD